MDVTKYKKYIRDASISDTELSEVIQDVINDIARDTKIFRNIISFRVSECITSYNIKTLYELSSKLDDEINTITYSVDTSTDETLNTINLITQDDTKPKECQNDNNGAVTETVTYISSNTKYLSTLDLFRAYSSTEEMLKNFSNTMVQSVINEYFIRQDSDTYNTDTYYLESLYGDKYSFDVLAYCSVIPNIEAITEDEEIILRSAIINGLKYYISDMYLNLNNEQVSNLLYQRYYSSKKQLLYNYPQNVSPQMFYNNAGWNK